MKNGYAALGSHRLLRPTTNTSSFHSSHLLLFFLTSFFSPLPDLLDGSSPSYLTPQLCVPPAVLFPSSILQFFLFFTGLPSPNHPPTDPLLPLPFSDRSTRETPDLDRLQSFNHSFFASCLFIFSLVTIFPPSQSLSTLEEPRYNRRGPPRYHRIPTDLLFSAPLDD